ncbi:MAG: MerR family DNA-binding protein [Cyanobacteriota bacterium]|nr:MerR family DNA-binding protein [Cyanobacteriota bacterium]
MKPSQSEIPSPTLLASSRQRDPGLSALQPNPTLRPEIDGEGDQEQEKIVGLLIGQVAAESGVPIKTIRFYEEQGLLTALGRSAGGFRLFSVDVLPRLAFIKRVQKLGMSLQEIREFLDIRDQGSYPCDKIHEKLKGKILDIDQRIEHLLSLKHHLLDLLTAWEAPPHMAGSHYLPQPATVTAIETSAALPLASVGSLGIPSRLSPPGSKLR